MEAAGQYDRFVQKYLKRTKRFKTLEEFEKSFERKQKKGIFIIDNLLTRIPNNCNSRRTKAIQAQFCDTESS